MGGVQRDNELHPLPLPMGEVAERSEDGEGISGCSTLSVAYGDSSPKGGAKEGASGTENGAYFDQYAPSAVSRPPIQSFAAHFCFLARYSSGSMTPFASIFSAQSCNVSTVMEIFSNSS